MLLHSQILNLFLALKNFSKYHTHNPHYSKETQSLPTTDFILQQYAAAMFPLRCLPSGNTHHTVWCSISRKSGTDDRHLKAFIYNLNFNYSLLDILPRILCWCQRSNAKQHSMVQNVLFYKLPRLNIQLKIATLNSCDIYLYCQV
jgi:hypothetical protein